MFSPYFTSVAMRGDLTGKMLSGNMSISVAHFFGQPEYADLLRRYLGSGEACVPCVANENTQRQSLLLIFLSSMHRDGGRV